MNNVFLRFPGGKVKAVTLSYDDNVTDDVRLSQIMQKYGLRGTFNVNSGQFSPEGSTGDVGKHGHRRLTLNESLELHAKDKMEIACHGVTHPFLEQLPAPACLGEIANDRQNLEDAYGCMVRGIAYPFGTFNENVIAAAKSSGIVYGRTTVSSRSFLLPEDWMKWDPTCHHTVPDLMELVERFLGEKRRWRPMLFYLWGHSYEFGDNDSWQILEEFGKLIGGRDDIWYATNIEIYDYVEAYGRLVFSADCKKVYNPTATRLWLETAAGVYEIAPGQTCSIMIEKQ